LKANQLLPERRLDITTDCVDWQSAFIRTMNFYEHFAAGYFKQLDVHAVGMQMPANGIERFLGIDAAINSQQIIGHEQHPDGSIAGEPIHKLFAADPNDCIEKVGKCGAVNGINALQQDMNLFAHGPIRMRFESFDQPRNLF
jgi:hypothetical protein